MTIFLYDCFLNAGAHIYGPAQGAPRPKSHFFIKNWLFFIFLPVAKKSNG